MISDPIVSAYNHANMSQVSRFGREFSRGQLNWDTLHILIPSENQTRLERSNNFDIKVRSTEIKTKTCIECTGIYNISSYILIKICAQKILCTNSAVNKN